MASQCPKCHQMLDEDYICCADIEFQWRCAGCHKRTHGFVIPFGKCELCGSELKRVEWEEPMTDGRILVLQEAFQIEVNSYHFYRRLSNVVDDPEISDFFESMADMEKEHAGELEEKYHLHLENEHFKDKGRSLPEPFFQALGFFADTGDLKRLYDCAIEMEKKTLDFFLKKADGMADGTMKELYLELAAEEREHVALLTSRRDR